MFLFDIKKVVTPELKKDGGDLYYINLSQENYSLGGSSFGQIHNKIGKKTASIKDAKYFKKVFNSIQNKIISGSISAGHDVSSGGLITTLLELCFSQENLGLNIDISNLDENDVIKVLFAENAGIVFQADAAVEGVLKENNIEVFTIGTANNSGKVTLKNGEDNFSFDVAETRDTWYKTSFLLDSKQS